MRSLIARMSLAGVLLTASTSDSVSAADPPTAIKISPGEWKKLTARRDELIKRVDELKKRFQGAEQAEQLKIREEVFKLADEFQTTIYPRLSVIAPKVYADDPSNFDAGEMVLEAAYQSNRYEDAVKTGEQLIAAGRKTALTLNLTGVSYFAMQDFGKAKAVLEEAQKAGELIPQLGGRYLELCDDYEDLWKAELVIREQEAKAEGDAQLPRVTFKTSRGQIVLELFENEAPNTVANFISLVEGKKYDGVKFHRVIPGFMAQGGDPNTLDSNPDNDGQGGPGYTIACECYREDARKHFRGSLSMAHAGKDTGGSQFFLTHLPTAHLNASVEEERGHTVFGRVVEGMNVVAALEVGDTIESATVTRKRTHPYQPETKAEAKAETRPDGRRGRGE
jgi:cyclophilin family peptidyl-prolyl cis-trans isomerase